MLCCFFYLLLFLLNNLQVWTPVKLSGRMSAESGGCSFPLGSVSNKRGVDRCLRSFPFTQYSLWKNTAMGIFDWYHDKCCRIPQIRRNKDKVLFPDTNRLKYTRQIMSIHFNKTPSFFWAVKCYFTNEVCLHSPRKLAPKHLLNDSVSCHMWVNSLHQNINMNLIKNWGKKEACNKKKKEIKRVRGLWDETRTVAKTTMQKSDGMICW